MRVDALRLVAGLNVPKATKSDRLRDLERSLSESDRSKVVSSITRLDDSVGLSLQELSQPSDASKTRQSEPSIPTWLPNPEEMVVLMMEHVGQDGIGFMQADFLDASRGDPLLTEFGIQYLQRTKTEDASELLRQSIVVLLVSGFEDFLAAMMRAHVRTSVRAADSYEDNVTLLLETSKRASDIVNGGIPKWLAVVSDEYNMPVASLMSSEWDELVEVLARRNAVVHASARADASYLKRLSASGISASLGDGLTCSSDYVVRAIRSVETVADLVAVGFAVRMAPNGSELATWSNRIVVESLKKSQWAIAEHVAARILRVLSKNHEEHELEVNRWMAIQQQPTKDQAAISAEIEDWVPPIDDDRFAIAKNALQRDDVAAIQTLTRGIARHSLNPREIEDWPLIVRLRKESADFGRAFVLALAGKTPAKRARSNRKRRHGHS